MSMTNNFPGPSHNLSLQRPRARTLVSSERRRPLPVPQLESLLMLKHLVASSRHGVETIQFTKWRRWGGNGIWYTGMNTDTWLGFTSVALHRASTLFACTVHIFYFFLVFFWDFMLSVARDRVRLVDRALVCGRYMGEVSLLGCDTRLDTGNQLHITSLWS